MKISEIICQVPFNSIHIIQSGTFSDGPFNPNEDPIGALITFVGCGPGKEIFALHYLLFSQRLLYQAIASVRTILKRR